MKRKPIFAQKYFWKSDFFSLLCFALKNHRLQKGNNTETQEFKKKKPQREPVCTLNANTLTD